MLSLENLWVILITTVAGLVVGITGFGYGLVATPLYATLMPMYQAVALVTISSLPLMVQNALSVRSSIPWREIWPVLTLSLPASALGTWALARSDTRYLEFILAAMTIMGALVSLWSPKKALLKRAWPGAYIAGVVGGFVGGAVATGGPPVVLYCLLRGWDKHRIKGLLSVYFTFTTLWRLLQMALNRLLVWEDVRLGLLLMVPAMLMCYIGTRIFRHISSAVFRYIIIGFLIVMALNLVLR